MTRVDDVINTCGHRLSTGRLEEVINEHSSVAESAVVGHVDAVRGECPIAFVILKGTSEVPLEEQMKITKEINEKVRHDIGPIARIEAILYVQKLPKTRSGKILRGTLKKIVNKEEYVTPATIEDISVLEFIQELAHKWIDDKLAAQKK
jgi:propionyl-CoA synthetase